MSKVRIETITPEKARMYLKNNNRNRKISQLIVQRYADDMRAGSWQFNGQTITIDKNGTLQDGQQRLLAVIESGVSIETVVVEGTEPEAMETIDVGKRRTVSDALYISGERDTNILGAIVTWYHRYLHGSMAKGGSGNAATRVTVHQARKILDDNPDIRLAVIQAHRVKHIIHPGIGGFLWYAFHQRDEILADIFFDALATGVNMKENDPVFLLRERLIQERGARRKLPDWQLAHLAVKAWNATVEGRELYRLQIGREDQSGFPIILPEPGRSVSPKARKPSGGKGLAGTSVPGQEEAQEVPS